MTSGSSAGDREDIEKDSPVEIRPYRPGDETSIVEGWNDIFPAQDALARRDVASWRWLFTRNPLGRVEIAVAIGRGRVVGQYASVPMRAVDDGKDTTIGLVVDAYVLPEWRRAGGRPGLIIHLARKLHECWCGPRATLVERGHSLLYGYPFPIWRVAQRYLASEMVRDMDVLFRELAVPGYVATKAPDGIVVEEHTRAGAIADELWTRLKHEMRFGIVRDSRYLDWRYADHPRHRYVFFVARDAASGKALGIAVYGHGRYIVEGAGLICDWLAARDDARADAALLAAVERRARADGAQLVLAVLPQNDPRFLRWQRMGFLVGPPSHFLVMNTFEHHVRHLRDVWSFTLGDSDLV